MVRQCCFITARCEWMMIEPLLIKSCVYDCVLLHPAGRNYPWTDSKTFRDNRANMGECWDLNLGSSWLDYTSTSFLFPVAFLYSKDNNNWVVELSLFWAIRALYWLKLETAQTSHVPFFSRLLLIKPLPRDESLDSCVPLKAKLNRVFRMTTAAVAWQRANITYLMGRPLPR